MPEGPSIAIAAEELAFLRNKTVLEVSGNSKQPIVRLEKKKILDVFSHGKRLNIQCKGFGLRIHFMLFGSYRVDEEREGIMPRLMLRTKGGTAYFYSCSARLEEGDLRAGYDFRIDVMSPEWDRKHVRSLVKRQSDETLDDILMDQDIFAGVGNIIKNEVLFRRRLLPTRTAGSLTARQLSAFVDEAHAFSLLFYELRKQFVLKKNLQIHRRAACPVCMGKVTHEKTGKRNRMSHYCGHCQK